MKNIFKSLVGLICATYLISCTSQPTNSDASLDTYMDTISYSIGLWVGKGPANVPDKEDLDIALITKGISDGINEKEGTDDLQALQVILREFAMEQQNKESMAAQKEGEDYIKKYKKKKGVVETESGLCYRVIKDGAGAGPAPTDTVTVNYKGTFINGDTFDSSYDRGEPAVFVLNRVIPGWTEGVQLMKEGAVYEFVIPSQLAYGPRGKGPNIGPNTTLVFEIELVKVSK